MTALRPRMLAPVLAVGIGLLAVLAVQVGGSADTGPASSPVATDRCATPETPPLQSGLHLIGDRPPPVPYSSVPPTSGWHRSGVAVPGVAAEPLSEPVQVGLLEVGIPVVTHGPLAPDDERALARLAAGRHEAMEEDEAPAVAVTAYPPLGEGEVVVAAWGVLQRCDGVDAAALERFVEWYGGTGPDTVHGG